MSEELLKVQNLKKFFQTPGGSLHARTGCCEGIQERNE